MNMKIKKYLFLLIGIFALSANAQSQSASVWVKNFLEKCYLDINMEVGTKQHDINPCFANFGLGYNFSRRLYAGVKAEYQLGLHEENGLKTYKRNTDLGACVGYQLDKPAEHGTTFDLQVSFLNSIGNADWKNTTYDIGIIMRNNSTNKKVFPYIGIGFRYIDSHTNGMSNHAGLYASLGVKL